MTPNSDARTGYRRGLAVAVAAVALAVSAGTAIAGSCPAGQAGENLISSGPNAPVGVTDEVIGQIDVSAQIPEIPGHLLRTRMLVVQPGGVVPFHSHAMRPALIYMLEGEMSEFSSTCIVPIVHRAGEIAEETVGVAHWWQNTGSVPARLLSSDIVPSPDDASMM
ncbi:MAG: cupin domain-containing protein [Alphaproteobacteria bacterium]